VLRALTPWRPFAPLSTLHREIDDLFTRFFDEDEWLMPRAVERPFAPSIESFTRNGELVVRADLPGIDPKNVELMVEGDRLMIRGERRETKEEKGTEYFRREVAFGRFERTVALPPGVDPDSVKAAYHEGVLEVTMKAPKGLASKKVPISVH
jgi:HSP20 family protein